MRAPAKFLAPALCAILFVVAAVAFARAADPLLKELVVREYPQAIKVLQDRFSNARGVVRQSVEKRGKRATVVASKRLAFECKGPDMARVVIDDLQMKREGDAGSLVGAATVLCSNRDYSFQLRKQDANAGYTLNRLEADAKAESRSRVGDTIFMSLFRYLNAPFTPYFNTLRITNERFSVRDVARVGGDGEKTLRIDFDTTDEKAWKALHGWLVVSPDQAWVLRSFEFTGPGAGGGKATYAGTIEYGDAQRGVPVPKRVVYTVGAGNGSAEERTECNFDEISLVDDVPDRDFTLAAFGLPEPGQPKPRPTGGPALWFFVCACVAMVAAVALKSVAARLRRKAASAGG